MPDNYFARYLPLLIHFLLAGALASVMVLLSWIIGYRKPSRAKSSPYECGMTPVGDARERFSVKFYMLRRKTDEHSTLVASPVTASQPRLIRYVVSHIQPLGMIGMHESRGIPRSFRQTKTPLNAYMRRLQYRPPCE
jgi:NADH-ubiquinone/plastoquinone oxidoreductase, chain 3